MIDRTIYGNFQDMTLVLSLPNHKENQRSKDRKQALLERSRIPGRPVVWPRINFYAGVWHSSPKPL